MRFDDLTDVVIETPADIRTLARIVARAVKQYGNRETHRPDTIRTSVRRLRKLGDMGANAVSYSDGEHLKSYLESYESWFWRVTRDLTDNNPESGKAMWKVLSQAIRRRIAELGASE